MSWKLALLCIIISASALGTWLGCVRPNGPHAAVHNAHPVSGMALRQGRRFSMEDRTVVDTSVLPGGACCNSVEYTYAAVYDGHDGSAACNMLQQQLHPLVRAAAASTWQSSCSIHTRRFQTALTLEAHRLNKDFLTKAQQVQQSSTELETEATSGLPKTTGNSSSSSCQHGVSEASSSIVNNGTAGLFSDATAAAGTAPWDGDDGSTAVFAVLAGRQLLIGNVGNSKAILCTSRYNSSANNSSNEYSQQAASRSDSLALQQQTNKAAAAVSSNQHRSSPGSSSGKAVAAYPAATAAASSRQPLAMPVSSSTSTSSAGTCLARSVAPHDPPAWPLVAIPLSMDHTPAREDEAARIQAAGGQVFANPATPGGKLRVFGELEVTRSFGDLGFQSQGVIPTPEFTAYDLQQGDAFVILASDGILEALSTEEVCQHAWGAWSGSSSIRTTPPPPPALALTGQVAAGGIQHQQAASSQGDAAAGDTIAALQGCCDCTPQQKFLVAAGTAGFDSGVVVQRRKGQRRGSKRAVLEQQHVQQVATAATIPEGNEVASTVRVELQGRCDTAKYGPQTAPNPAEKHLVPHQQSLQQQQKVKSVTALVGHIGAEEPDTCSELLNQCSPGDAGHESGDTCGAEVESDPYAELIDEYSVADKAYGHCIDPINITSPYTLPQAVALRLVGEAYNRLSMDNLAVVLLDVRHLAAPTLPHAANTHQTAFYMTQWAASWFVGKVWTMAAVLHDWVATLFNIIIPTQLSKPDQFKLVQMGQHVLTSIAEGVGSLSQRPDSTRKIGDMASSGFRGDGSSSSSCIGSHCETLGLHLLPSADLEALRALDVLLPACGVHELIETSEGLFVGPRGLWLSDTSQSGLDAAAGVSLKTDVLHDGARDGAHDVEGITGGAVSVTADGQLHSNAGNTNKLTSDGVKGVAIVCEDGPVASVDAHTMQNQEVVDQQRNYRLLEQLGSVFQPEADHMHLHPVLGTDEVPVTSSQPPEGPHHKDTAPSAPERDLVDLPLLSVSRHVRPRNMFDEDFRLAGVDEARLNSVQQPNQMQAIDTSGQQYCQSVLQDKVSRQPFSATPKAADGIASIDGQAAVVRQVTDEPAGFLSICLVGTAADPDVVVTQGGQGLSAVVEALAAVPLQDGVEAVIIHPGESFDVAALPQQTESMLHDGLLEPAWGDGNKEPHKVLPHQQIDHNHHGLGPLVKAGLLLMATSRPGRVLLSRHLGSQHALQHHESNPNSKLSNSVKDASSAPVALQEQHTSRPSSSLSSVMLKDGFQSRYRLGKQAGRGHFGEVWLAARSGASLSNGRSVLRGKGGPAGLIRGVENGEAGHVRVGDNSAEEGVLVIKRVSGASSEGVQRSALREAYFGQVLQKRKRHLAAQVSKQRTGMDKQYSADSSTAASSAEALLAGHEHLVRFVEGFTTKPEGDVWLVFQHEGRSLHALMYEASSMGCELGTPHDQEQEPQEPCGAQPGLSLVGPSKWWMKTRASTDGNLFVASMMQQLLQGLEALHAANISHRDVKPENLLVASTDTGNPKPHQLEFSQLSPLSLHLRLIDFGSAVDLPSLREGLYGARSRAGDETGREGPTLDELTIEYAPPEVLFSSRYRHPLAAGVAQLHAYDIWSAGVVMLELILGTPSVFTPSPATRAAIDRQLHLSGRPQEERRLLYVLRGLMELCIYPPRVKPTPSLQQQAPTNLHNNQQSAAHGDMTGAAAVPIPWSCSDEALLQLLSSRDPQGIGLEGGLGVRLLQRLLAWQPSQRPTAAQALRHAYFVAADHMQKTGTTATSEFYQSMLVHCSQLAVGEVGWC